MKSYVGFIVSSVYCNVCENDFVSVCEVDVVNITGIDEYKRPQTLECPKCGSKDTNIYKIHELRNPNSIKKTGIGEIGNYYGGVYVCNHNGKYYWIIENFDTDFDNIEEWEEISEQLYTELINHNKRKP